MSGRIEGKGKKRREKIKWRQERSGKEKGRRVRGRERREGRRERKKRYREREGCPIHTQAAPQELILYPVPGQGTVCLFHLGWTGGQGHACTMIGRWMGRWVNGRMDGWVAKWVGGQINRWLDRETR